MKTKHLFSTMVIAAALAGCSSDEWSDNNAPSSLDNRRAAGKVEFTLPDASTRMEENENGAIVFSADDHIAATLMDEFKGAYPVTDFVNYIQTNYPFESEDGKKWTSTGVLLEGNYFFSYPFNACLQSRGAVTNTVPVNQLAYDKKTGKVSTMQAYVDNQFYLGYSYINADAECTDCNEIPALKSTVKLEKIHAYPVFRFINQTGAPADKPLKVYKLSLRKKDHSMFYNTVAVFPKTKNFNPEAAENEQGKYDLWKTAVFNPNMPGNEINSLTVSPFDCSVVDSKTLEYNLIFPEGGYELANWTSFEASMIVPAGIYGEMEVVLYTNEGVGTYPVFMPQTGEDYQVQSGTYKLTPNKKSVTTVRFDITSLKTNQTDFIVQSTENLLEYLKYYHLDPDGVSGNAVKLNITTVGDKVELSQEVYNELKNQNLKINLNGIITIPAGVPADAIDRINFFAAGAKVINNGTQVIKEIPASDKNIKDSNVQIVNNGTLTLEANLPHSFIENHGNLIVENSDVFALLNMPEAKLTVNEELNVINLRNYGEATINAGATVNVLEFFANAGLLTNNGTLNTWPMRLVNKLSIYDAWIYDWSEVVWDGEEKIQIYVGYDWLLMKSDMVASNIGKIENNGVIDCNGLVNVDLYETNFGTVVEEDGKFQWIYDRDVVTVASVSSLVNFGTIDNNVDGRITNMSNCGMLVPDVKSYTSLVLIELPNEFTDAIEAVKAELVGVYTLYNYGLIDMSKNDGKNIDDQAVIKDNITKKDIEPFADHGQIIYVKRDKVNFNVTTPKYINTLWLENATGTVSADTNIADYTLWLSGKNNITVANGKTLTLGFTSIAAEATRFLGTGTTKLTQDVKVNEGVKLTVDNTWSATKKVTIWAEGATVVEGGNIDETNISIDKESLADFVGPWVIK